MSASRLIASVLPPAPDMGGTPGPPVSSQMTLYGPQRVTDSYLTLAEPRDSEIGLARQ